MTSTDTSDAPVRAHPVITVFVRLGDDEDEFGPGRIMMFQRPDTVADADALGHGYAIDGRDLVTYINGHSYDPLGPRLPLFVALRREQESLVSWLGAHGYEVTFR